MVKIDISLREVVYNLPHKFVEILTNKKGVKLLSFSRYRLDINERLLNDIKEKVMPITIDLQNDPYFNKGLKTGIQKGIQKGKIIVLKELGFSKEEMAKKLNISVYEIDKILKD